MTKYFLPIVAVLLAALPALAQQKDEAADYPNHTVRILVSPNAGNDRATVKLDLKD